MTDPHHCDEAADEARRYHWEEVSPDTPQVIVDALGGAGAGRSRPEIEPVRVVRAGVQTPWPTPGTLLFEDGTRQAVAGFLPADLPLGYHEFTPDDGRPKTRLIVTPWRCVVPASRRWGWAVQVYAARSAASWGIGDLADLRRLAKWSARLGAGFLMINPLGAPAPVLPQAASPYYPTSRRFYNPLYLRIEEVPGAEQLGPDLERLAAAGHALNATGRIDRDRVFRLKQEALRAIWAGFRGDPAWDRFRREQGPSLVLFGTYCVLAERFGADWRQWPAEYRRPEDPQVQRFAAQQSDDVAYHQWLQWLLDEQLARAARTLPLVQDLPIGFDPGGADAWQWQDLLAAGVSTGAPPDEFNADGQDWQLPPFVPWKLRAAGYQPLIETLRATLRHAGGLRIDHVMVCSLPGR
jgi:4-alpha-glucanotransferase